MLLLFILEFFYLFATLQQKMTLYYIPRHDINMHSMYACIYTQIYTYAYVTHIYTI